LHGEDRQAALSQRSGLVGARADQLGQQGTHGVGMLLDERVWPVVDKARGRLGLCQIAVARRRDNFVADPAATPADDAII